jgi:small GTP-binding protein
MPKASAEKFLEQFLEKAKSDRHRLKTRSTSNEKFATFLVEMSTRRVKIIFIGPCSVGKTSIVRSYFDRQFTGATPPTIGSDCFNGSIPADTGPVNVTVWDTAGAEQYRALAPRYYRGAQCIVFVFDVTSEKSLKDLRTFLPDVKSICPEALRFLVGNKSDLDERIEGFHEKFAECAGTIDAVEWLQTSAQKGEGIDDLFESIARRVSNQTTKLPDDAQPQTVDIAAPANPPQPDRCC